MMKNATVICKDELRRHHVREKNFNGLDYLEVYDNNGQPVLVVYFMNKLGEARERINKENVLVQGGRRITDIQVLNIGLCVHEDPERDDCMEVWLDKYGDASTYTLCLVEVDEHKRPIVERESGGRKRYRPLQGFDPRYACLEFSFQAGCPSDLDCKQERVCPPPERVEPEINYLAKDYASFRQLILDRLALIMPDWRERHVPDVGIALVELLAYAGDHLSYYQDAVATEAYLDTARQRISVRRHARLVDYQMHEGCNARAWVWIELKGQAKLALDLQDVYLVTRYDDSPVTGESLTSEDLANTPASRYEVFEPLVENANEPITLYQAHNTIRFYTWGDRECCLPKGATTATLRDEWVFVQESKPEEQAAQGQQPQGQESPKGKPETEVEPPEPTRKLQLKEGDLLIFEEVIGPKTGNKADADPTRRHAVRLTRVELGEDPLYQQPEGSSYNQPIVEIEWAEEDALPFPLCISTIGPAPDCEFLEDISVARGNLLLVDHGRRVENEELGTVPAQETTPTCEAKSRPSDVQLVAGRFRPVLERAPLTFSQPLPANTPASRLLSQDPRKALPYVAPFSIPPTPGATPETAIPLFSPDALKNSTALRSLALKLRDAQDSRSDHLRALLSLETQKLLDDYEDSAPLSAALAKALLDDLHGLLQPWHAKRDLLASRGADPHFVVEMDNRQRAHLRFGDGELGLLPEAGAGFLATYRVGNGPAGNVGAEMISHLVLRRTRLSGVTLRPRNPFPAQGGIAPEPLAEIKLFAPYAFRKELQRAITAQDYADIVMREFEERAQRAAATLRWNGSWHEVLVAVDPLGQVEADQALLDEVKEHLGRYQRIGHDLAVRAAQYIPLDIEMTVCVLPHYLRGHVKAALLNLFSNRRLPDGRLGFFHPDNLTFGEGILLSKLVATARSVPGVENVAVTRLERLYEGSNGELEADILPLGPLEIARLDNDPTYPEHGQFKLVMRGGR